jgi:hypothetical protein
MLHILHTVLYSSILLYNKIHIHEVLNNNFETAVKSSRFWSHASSGLITIV